jgi:hypothetical protein
MTPRQTQALQYLSQIATDFIAQFPPSVKQAMVEKVNIELEVLNPPENKNQEHG